MSVFSGKKFNNQTKDARNRSISGLGSKLGDPEGLIKLKFGDISHIETAKGSIYKYLADQRTQRFKTAENRLYDAEDALVFIPTYEWVQRNAPPHIRDSFGKSERYYVNLILEYAQLHNRRIIIHSNGKRLYTNKEISETKDQIFLAFLVGERLDFQIPVSKVPRLGWKTFDTTKFQDDGGEWKTSCHVGNAVTKIVLKNGTVIQ